MSWDNWGGSEGWLSPALVSGIKGGLTSGLKSVESLLDSADQATAQSVTKFMKDSNSEEEDDTSYEPLPGREDVLDRYNNDDDDDDDIFRFLDSPPPKPKKTTSQSFSSPQPTSSSSKEAVSSSPEQAPLDMPSPSLTPSPSLDPLMEEQGDMFDNWDSDDVSATTPGDPEAGERSSDSVPARSSVDSGNAPEDLPSGSPTSSPPTSFPTKTISSSVSPSDSQTDPAHSPSPSPPSSPPLTPSQVRKNSPQASGSGIETPDAPVPLAPSSPLALVPTTLTFSLGDVPSLSPSLDGEDTLIETEFSPLPTDSETADSLEHASENSLLPSEPPAELFATVKTEHESDGPPEEVSPPTQSDDYEGEFEKEAVEVVETSVESPPSPLPGLSNVPESLPSGSMEPPLPSSAVEPPPPTTSPPQYPSPSPSLVSSPMTDEVSVPDEIKKAAAANERADKSVRENVALRKEVKALNVELKGLSKRYHTLRKEHKMTETEVTIAREGLVKHQQAHDSELKALRETNVAVSNRLREVERELKDLRVAHASELSAYETTANSASSHTLEVEGKISTLQSKYEDVSLEKAELEKELSQNKVELTNLMTLLGEEREQRALANSERSMEIEQLQEMHAHALRESEERLQSLELELHEAHQNSLRQTAKVEHLLSVKDTANSLSGSGAGSQEDLVSVSHLSRVAKEKEKFERLAASLEQEKATLLYESSQQQVKFNRELEQLQRASRAEQEALTESARESEASLVLLQQQNESLQLNTTKLTATISSLNMRIEELNARAPQPAKAAENSGVKTSQLSELTDHLLRKQKEIERLESEKTTLQLRLEAAEQLKSTAPSEVSIPIAQSDADRDPRGLLIPRQRAISSLVPTQIARENPAGRVLVSGLDSVDSCTGQLGRYLRMMPGLRLGAFVYIIFLHVLLLWILTLWSHDVKAVAVASTRS